MITESAKNTLLHIAEKNFKYLKKVFAFLQILSNN